MVMMSPNISNEPSSLSEAEIQLLASLAKANQESAPTDKASLEKSGKRFWTYLEDWTGPLTVFAARTSSKATRPVIA